MKITETEMTCRSCGHVSYYGKAEELISSGAAMQQAGKSMMCCSGCGPAAFLPTQKSPDLSRCPQCGSRAIVKRKVIHEV